MPSTNLTHKYNSVKTNQKPLKISQNNNRPLDEQEKNETISTLFNMSSSIGLESLN